MAKATALTHRVDQYAERVHTKDIVAGPLVRLACKRHLDDLQNQSAYSFDPERGAAICKFAEKLPHVKGRWKSPYLVLEPWQCFLVVVLFGWRNCFDTQIIIPRGKLCQYP